MPATRLELVKVKDKAAAKEQRRALKRENKRLADNRRPLSAWERYRSQWDAIDLKRQMIDMGDNKVRFALVIVGALNAGLFMLLTRGQSAAAIPVGLRPWFGTLAVLYGIVSFGFVMQAIEALRPRPADRARMARHMRAVSAQGAFEPARLFMRDPGEHRTLDEEMRRWNTVRLDQVTADLVSLDQAANNVLEKQYAALNKVYTGLKVLTALAAVLLSLLAAAWIAGSRGAGL
jgi:hypothetical protein